MKILNIPKKKLMKISRKQKEEHFYSLCQEHMTVLDVGVSSEVNSKGLPARNYFLKNYRYAPKSYTGLSIQELSGMEALFPGKRFVQYPGGKFPFNDRAFNWVFSNAVIEHVGGDDAQLRFINEMLRVADHVFFTTPNKYFPVESHTNALFLHWNDTLFYSWCKKYRKWITKNSLYLLPYRRLKTLLELSDCSNFTIYKNRIAGIPMTFTVTCTSL